MQNLAKAFIQFQFNCPPIEKDSEVSVKTNGGGTYKFAYATFGNIVQTIKKPMYEAKIAYTFLTSENKFTCRILHESGEYQDTSLDMPKFREKMQENGSFLTYLKRYSLVLALGLDTDADEDGNLADQNHVEITKQKYQPKESVKSTEKYIEKKGKDIGNYVIKVGKFKDRRLADVDQLQIHDYLTWLSNQAKANNKPLSGDWLEFAKIAESYLVPSVDTEEPLS